MKGKIIGFCKECLGEIRDTDLIPTTISIFECGNCNHPHMEDEIEDYNPDGHKVEYDPRDDEDWGTMEIDLED